jgi:hypothetical protein
MPDPIVTAARRLTAEALDVLRAASDGLTAEALDWKPAGPDTNSIAVLTIHSLHATRLLARLALGLTQPERDRSSEFTSSGHDAADLHRLLDEIGGECLASLDGAPDTIDWSATRRYVRDDGSSTEGSAAYFILHSVDHLRGHADEAGLTRYCWDTRS